MSIITKTSLGLLLLMLIGCTQDSPPSQPGYVVFCKPDTFGECGLIKDGETILEARYSIRVYPDDPNAAPQVLKDGLWYFVDEAGNFSEQGFTEISAPSEGIVVIRTPLSGFATSSGEIIVEPQYFSLGSFSEGLISFTTVVRTDEGRTPITGFLNKAGDVVIEPRFASRYSFHFLDGIAPVLDHQILKWGYIDKSGNWIISPQFTEAYPFVGDYAVADKLILERDGRYLGVINKQGETVLPFVYDEISISENGEIFLEKDNVSSTMSVEELLVADEH